MKPATHKNAADNSDNRPKSAKNPILPPNPSDEIHNPVGANLGIIIETYTRPANREILHLNYGIVTTPFGNALLSWCNRGICSLTFCDTEPDKQLQKLSLKWPAATLNHKPEPAAKLAEKIFQPTRTNSTLVLLLQGTDFQINIWRALLHTQTGQTISYSQLAQMAGAPKAQRAVGSAMAANPIVYLVPCHRVIKKNGALGNYGGGIRRKRNILEWESKQR